MAFMPNDLTNSLRRHARKIPGAGPAYDFLRGALSQFSEPASQVEAETAADYAATKANIGGFIRSNVVDPKSTKVAVFISFTNVPFWGKLHGVLAKGLQLRGYRTLMINHGYQRWGNRYFKLFGLEVVDWEDVLKRHAPPDEFVAAEVGRLLRIDRTFQSLKHLTYHDVSVGRHALSQTCRKLVQGRLDLRHYADRGR